MAGRKGGRSLIMEGHGLRRVSSSPDKSSFRNFDRSRSGRFLILLVLSVFALMMQTQCAAGETASSVSVNQRTFVPSDPGLPPGILTGDEISWIAAHRTIRLGVDPEFAPFEFVDEAGNYQGLVADYVDLLNARLGLDMQLVPDLSWNQVIESARSGRIDVLAGVGRTVEREAYLNFTKPYLHFVRAIVSLSERAASISGLDSLQGLRVGVQENTSYSGYLQEHTDITPVAYPSLQAALIGVSNGEVDAFIGNVASAIYWIRQLNLTDLQIAGPVSGEAQNLHFASRKDWPELQLILQKGLDDITAAERIEISRRWVSVNDFTPVTDNTPADLSPLQKTWLRDHPVINTGIDPDWPPIEFLSEEGEYQGISSEYLDYLAASLSVDMRPVPGLSWEQVMAGVKAAEIDLLPAVARTADREEYLNFTEPYLRFPLVVFTRDDVDDIDGLADLSGKHVVVERDYLAHELLTKGHPGLILTVVSDSETALRLLAHGEADAYVGNLVVASHIISHNGYTNLKVTASTDYTYDLSVGVRKDWPELIPILQRALDGITPDQKAAIQQKWLAIRYDLGVDYTLLWRVVSVGVAILVLGAIWLIFIRHQRELLATSEERFQLAMAAAAEGIWDWDLRTGKVYYSPGYLSILGYEQGEVGDDHRAWVELLHPRDKEGAVKVVEAAIGRSARRYEHQFRLRSKDGRYRDIYSRGGVVSVDPQGKALRAVGTQLDVTSRVRAEERLSLFQRFAETSGQGFSISLFNGEITYVNDALRRMLGEPSSEAVCQGNYARYYSVEIEEYFVRKITPVLENTGKWVGELTLVTASGEQLPTLQNLFVIADQYGKPRYVGNVITDISMQKQTEEALEQARQQAEEASHFKGEFLANMSHEVRTPLNAIIGLTHLARQSDLTPRQEDYLDKIQYSSNALLAVVNDILDFSKIEAGRLEIEETDFQLEAVFDGLNGLQFRRRGEMEVEVIYSIDPAIPRTLRGDPLRLGQVLSNLTSNAVKFTEQGQIVVAVKLLEQREQQVSLSFSVRDTGVGIDSSRLEHLFDPFTQADGSTTRKYGGTGLGLSICKQLVSMMGGELGVDSEPGIGSTFYFNAGFKLTREQPEPRQLPAQNLRGMRVLLADDNAMARQTLAEILESFSFKVTTVASGAAALAEVERASTEQPELPYKLLLMDWNMSGMDGIEASRLIHQSGLLPQLATIIMVSGHDREEVLQAANQVGIEGFLVKPVSPSILFDTLMQTLAPASKGLALGPPSSQPLSVPDLNGIAALVVEDNRINQQVAKELLEKAGITVDIVRDGAQAIKAVDGSHFDLVLMDVQMPDMDGYQATRMMRKDPRFEQLPIIAMTAHALVGDREKCLAAGMDDYLTKPIDPTKFYVMLEKWAGRSKTRAVSEIDSTPNSVSSRGDTQLERFDSPGIDGADGLAHVGGNSELYQRLLMEFVADHGEDAKLLTNLLAEPDRESARRLVHTLRGIAGNIGAVTLELLGARLEQSLIVGSVDDAAHELFTAELTLVVQGLTSRGEGGDERSWLAGAVFDENKGKSLIDGLELSLVEGDVDVIHQLRQCWPYLARLASAEKLTILEGHIAGYDFDDALVVLRTITRNRGDSHRQEQIYE